MSFNLKDYIKEDSQGNITFDFKKHSFCPAMWMSMYYKGNNQGMKPCCSIDGYGTRNDGVGPEALDPTMENYQSRPWIKSLKDDFLNNKFPKECHACIRNEAHDQVSDRMAYWDFIDTWEEVDRLQEQIDKDNLELWHLDYRPSNLCNLKCRMCDPINSSLVVKENIDNDLKLDMIMGPSMYIDGEATDWDYIRDIESIKNLKSVKVLGGEPTVEKKVFALLDLIQENDLAKNINLQYTTNATNLNQNFYKRLHGYKHVTTTFSLDGTGKTYEYIRTPAKWDSVYKNLQGYIDFKKENDVTGYQYGCSINNVVSVFNTLTIKDWYEELNDILFSLGGNRITMIYCTNEWQAIDILPKFALQEMKNQFNNLPQRIKDLDHSKSYETFIDKALKEEYTWEKARLLNTFFWHNDKLDAVRKTKLVDIAPIWNDIREFSKEHKLEKDMELLQKITDGNPNRKWKNWNAFLQGKGFLVNKELESN